MMQTLENMGPTPFLVQEDSLVSLSCVCTAREKDPTLGSPNLSSHSSYEGSTRVPFMDRDQLMLGTDHETLSPKELMPICQHVKRAGGQGNVLSSDGTRESPKACSLKHASSLNISISFVVVVGQVEFFKEETENQ